MNAKKKLLYKPPPADDDSGNYCKLWIVIAISVVFIAAEFVGGYISGSISVISDAFHLVTDLIGFIVSFAFIYVAKKQPTLKMSFGFHRMEIIGALANLFIIWVLAIFLVYEATDRIIHKDFVAEPLAMLIVGAGGLAVNIVMYFVLHSGSHSHGLMSQPCQGHGPHDNQPDVSNCTTSFCNQLLCDDLDCLKQVAYSHCHVADKKGEKKIHSHENDRKLSSELDGPVQQYQNNSMNELRNNDIVLKKSSTKQQKDHQHGQNCKHHQKLPPLKEKQHKHSQNCKHNHQLKEMNNQKKEKDHQHNQNCKHDHMEKKQSLEHKHGQNCKHDHDHKQKNHQHDHQHEHQHQRNHESQHDHQHQGNHDHDHKHNENCKDKHDYKEKGHKHDHKKDHKHDHKHEHSHEDHQGHNHQGHNHQGHDHQGHDHSGHGHSHQSIGMQAAVLHAFSDIIQSIGLLISSLFIYFLGSNKGSHVSEWNDWHYFDPIATYVFSVFVIISTFPIAKNCYFLIMESTPSTQTLTQLKKLFQESPGVVDVHDLHIWDLRPGKTLVMAHVFAKEGSERDVLTNLTQICRRKKIFHSTLQVEQANWKDHGQYILCDHNIH